MENDHNVWLDIAITDLSAARVLYKEGLYSQSYFLFQQASEKANKAFALKADLLAADDLQKTSHDQFKVYRKMVDNRLQEINSFKDTLASFPKVRDHEFMGTKTFEEYGKQLAAYLSFSDGLRNMDLINIELADINLLYKSIVQINKMELKPPKQIDRAIRKSIRQMADWAARFETPQSLHSQQELLALLKDNEQSKQVREYIWQLLAIIKEISFIQLTLYSTAYLTIQHSSHTRYPKEDKNPLTIYTRKLPIVKKQPQFMDLLEIAIQKIRTM